MDKPDIIPGYQGILSLNLDNMDPKYRKQAVSQHNNDIDAYKKYQRELSPRLRYENTICRAEKKHNLYNMALIKRADEAKHEQMIHYARRIREYTSSNEYK